MHNLDTYDYGIGMHFHHTLDMTLSISLQLVINNDFHLYN
jgi:hypothetical protein